MKKKKCGTMRKDLFLVKNSLGTLVFDAYGKVQTTYTIHFEEDTLQHAQVEGQPALPWGPCTNSNHTVKRSHTWLHLGEDDCNDRVFHDTLAFLVWKVLFCVMVEKSKRKVFGEHVSISDWWISFYCVDQIDELKFYAMLALG